MTRSMWAAEQAGWRVLQTLSEAEQLVLLHELVDPKVNRVMIKRGRRRPSRSTSARVGTAVFFVLAVILLYVLIVMQLSGAIPWGDHRGPFSG